MHEKMRIQVNGDITQFSKFHRNYTTFIQIENFKNYFSQRNYFVTKKTSFEIFGNIYFFEIKISKFGNYS